VVECASRQPPDWLGIARWTAIGAGQGLVYGAAAAVMWALRAPGRAFMLDRAVRGLGKVFWSKPFEIQFYGQSAASRPITEP